MANTIPRGIHAVRRLHLASIIIFCLVSFGNTFFMDFVYDDIDFICNNESIRDIKRIPTLFTQNLSAGIKGAPTEPYYRPISAVSTIVDYQLWGTWPAGHHLTNILLHITACILVYLTTLRLLADERAALAAALLFAVHPVHCEAVTWVSARTDIIPTIFILAAFLFHLRATGTNRMRNISAGMFFTFCALLSKETGVLVPILILAYEIWQKERKPWNLIKLPALYALPIIPYMVLRGTAETADLFGKHPFTWRLATGLEILPKYLGMLFMPIYHRVFFDIPIQTVLMTPNTIVKGIFMILVCCFAIFLWMRRSIFGFALVWILATLMPVSALPAIIQPAPMAERYLYLPSFGVAIIFGELIRRFYQRTESLALPRFSKVAPVLLAALFAFSSVVCIWRNTDWRNDFHFCEMLHRDAPRHPIGGIMRAWHAEQAGDFEKARVLLTSAIANSDRAVPNMKLKALAHANLGVILHSMGKSGEGLGELEKAVAIIPDNPLYHYKLGLAARQSGNRERARAAFSTAVVLSPTLQEARDALAGI